MDTLLDGDVKRVLPDSVSSPGGQLHLAGCDLEELAARYGTPLYVYDEATLRGQAQRVRDAFHHLDAHISFAAKACATPAVLRVLRDAGLGLDVVSGGELEAGRRAGFDPARIHLHGNCKSDAELEAAVRHGLRAVVLDNLDELERLEKIGRAGPGKVPVSVRLTPAQEAETHPHLQTSGPRSKFGILRGSYEESLAFGRLQKNATLELTGLHVHLGSQVSNASIYRRAACDLAAVAADLRRRGFGIVEVSVGGGWAVPYTTEDAELRPEEVARAIEPAFAHVEFRPAVEPGRWLVARAGLALYRVMSVKTCAAERLVAVDGGMGDNPRPALYGARYSALVPGRALHPPEGLAHVVGRYCESSDLLAQSVLLPEVRPGDLLCIPVSGAYQLSMASAYNLVPPPAVVLVAHGKHRLVTRRGTLDDLLCREILTEVDGEDLRQEIRGGGER